MGVSSCLISLGLINAGFCLKENSKAWFEIVCIKNGFLDFKNNNRIFYLSVHPLIAEIVFPFTFGQ